MALATDRLLPDAIITLGQAVKNLDRNMTDSRKQAVSIRMSRGDVRNIKRLAERLGARDSDVIRFAIKLMLAQLAPLQDPTVGGRGLVPVFLESGPELMRHFELDASRLVSIINDGVEADRQVDPQDVQLIAMSALERSYIKLRSSVSRRGGPHEGGNGNGNGHDNGAGQAHGNGHGNGEAGSPEQSLRQYLYEKYLYTRIPILSAGSGVEK
jgi:hypothetical protein